jgi:hypothetical protein
VLGESVEHDADQVIATGRRDATNTLRSAHMNDTVPFTIMN